MNSGCMPGYDRKGIDQLRADLAAVDADCAKQIRKTVHDNFHYFIQACQVLCSALTVSINRRHAATHTICRLTLHESMAVSKTCHALLCSKRLQANCLDNS